MAKQKTNFQFKLLYAIGIVLIVAGHSMSGSLYFLTNWFPYYAYHLPLFMFCSGYFYKKCDTDHINQSIYHKVKRLIIPMYIYNLVYGLLTTISLHYGFQIGKPFSLYNFLIAPWNDGHQFMYNLGGWFVAPLFMIYIINLLFRKLTDNKLSDTTIFIVYSLIGIAGIYASLTSLNLVISRICYFLPFYGFGTLYRSTLEEKDKVSNLPYFTILFILQLLIIIKKGYAPSSVPAWGTGYTDPITPFIIGYIGIFFWLRVTRFLTPAFEDSRFIPYLADNTYSIMMNHIAGFMIIKFIFALIFKDFNMDLCKQDIWYYYLPYNVTNFYLVYLVNGLLFPILVQLGINKLKSCIGKNK